MRGSRNRWHHPAYRKREGRGPGDQKALNNHDVDLLS